MSKKKLFKSSAFILALLGAGMLLGHSLSTGNASTGLWLGIISVLAGAVLFGMSVSSTEKPKSTEPPHANPDLK